MRLTADIHNPVDPEIPELAITKPFLRRCLFVANPIHNESSLCQAGLSGTEWGASECPRAVTGAVGSSVLSGSGVTVPKSRVM